MVDVQRSEVWNAGMTFQEAIDCYWKSVGDGRGFAPVRSGFEIYAILAGLMKEMLDDAGAWAMDDACPINRRSLASNLVVMVLECRSALEQLGLVQLADDIEEDSEES